MCWPLYHLWLWIGRDTGGSAVFRCSHCGQTERRTVVTVATRTAYVTPEH